MMHNTIRNKSALLRQLNGMSRNIFDFCFPILISLHLYVQEEVYHTLLMYCGAAEVTVEFECFYSNSEPVTLPELQFTECRRMDSIVASGELSLFFFSARQL